MNSLANSVSECQKINLNNRLTQSHEKFLQRLKTFELFKWFGKSAEFSPIECARRGWINLSRDTLKCVSCSNIFYHYTQSSLTISKHQASLSDENFKKTVFAHDPRELVDKHNKNCPWRTLCVSDKLIQVDIYDEDRIYQNFLARIDSFKKCNQLPKLTDTALKTLDDSVDSAADADSRRLVVQIHGSSSKQRYKINRNALIMASCGWTFNASLNVVNCEKCLRSVGLWLYKTEPNLFDDKKLLKQESPSPHELLTQLSHIEEDSDNNQALNYLSEVHAAYSNELVIENLLKNMVKCIEVNQQAELKHQSMNQAGAATENKKRKPATIDSNEDSASVVSKRMCLVATSNGDESCALRRASDSLPPPPPSEKKEKSKLFDPLSEHFSYCPWLKGEEHANFSASKRSICQIHSDIIKRYLSKLEEERKEDKNAATNERADETDKIGHIGRHGQAAESLLLVPPPFDDSILRAKYKSSSSSSSTAASFTSEEITDRIKSVQSLLINCTSQCSFGQMANKTN